MLMAGMAPAAALANGAQARRPKAERTSVSSKAKMPAKKKVGTRRRVSRRIRGQKAPTADRVREIQQALAREGAYAGEPTGRWDGATIEAMKRFQSSQGLNPTGKIDALSLQKLGLGSPVAGAAAPLPPINASPEAATAEKSAVRSPNER
jgi:peptidoglycan hydrolase-like protein with peptidoglycan-binding domain